MGDPGSFSGVTKLDSSSREPPSGGRSITILQRAPGMPQTVSTNSPSTDAGSLDLETEAYEERRRRIEVRDGDSDVVETLDVRHGCGSFSFGGKDDDRDLPVGLVRVLLVQREDVDHLGPEASRSDGVARRARQVNSFRSGLDSDLGSEMRFLNQSGSSSAPPLEATITKSSPDTP